MLPSGNRYVRYGSRSAIYRPGKEVEIGVRLSDEAGLACTKRLAAEQISDGRVGCHR
jgi:hypothetical protein